MEVNALAEHLKDFSLEKRTSVTFISEEKVSRVLPKDTNLFECRTVDLGWTIDRLSDNVTVRELYYDWPKWKRHVENVPTRIFDFTTIVGGRLEIEVDHVPKSLEKAMIVFKDKLDATSGKSYPIEEGEMKHISAHTFRVHVAIPRMKISIYDLEEVGDFGFLVDFFDSFGNLGHTNIYQYSVFAKQQSQPPDIEIIQSQERVPNRLRNR